MSDGEVALRLPKDFMRSQGDEDAFLNWLYSIPGYVTCEGIGCESFVNLGSADGPWFSSPEREWHSAVFRK